MICTIDDAMDVIQGEIARAGDGTIELDVWENKSEGEWYAAIRDSETKTVLPHYNRNGRGTLIDNGPTLRAAVLALARRIAS